MIVGLVGYHLDACSPISTVELGERYKRAQYLSDE